MTSPALFDAGAGLLNPAVYSSRAVYRDEVSRLFGRAWLMVGPEAWLARSGDFLTTTMGEEPVLLWTDPSGQIRAFENRCVAGVELLTSAERGCAETLVCGCHGWTYSLSETAGSLCPQSAAQAERCDGLVFANADPAASSLKDGFGEFDWYWSLVLDLFGGRIDVYGDTTLRTRLDCNWKLAIEAFCGDVYSDLTLHQATRDVLGEPARSSLSGFQAAAGGGTMVISTQQDGALQRAPAGQRGELFPLSAVIFPNLSFDGRTGTLHLWHPRGPTQTEVHTYCLAGSSESLAEKEARRRRAALLFGPTGLETQDQESVWRAITRASRGRIARGRWLNMQMGLGRERKTNLPGCVTDLVSEMNQRAFYGWWQAHLDHDPPFRRGRSLQLRPRQFERSGRPN